MTSRNKFSNYIAVLLCVGVAIFDPVAVAHAAELVYQPLVGIPGVDNAATNFNAYINQLYFLAISLAALIAVVKIIIGGVKWMLTDVVTDKGDAKDEIRGAVLGLLLIISSVIILDTINPELKNLNVLSGAPALRTQNFEQYGPPAPGGPTTAQNAAPITQTTNPTTGSTTHQVTYNPQERARRTQSVTERGVTNQFPVISMAEFQRYEFQRRELDALHCGGRGFTETNPQTVIVENENLGNRITTRTVYASTVCK